MVIIGARGLAKELLAVLNWNGNAEDLWFFDNVNADTPDRLYGSFPVLKSWDALREHFSSVSPRYALGVGGSAIRARLAEKVASMGGELHSIISDHSLVGAFGNRIGRGVCILSHVTITCDVTLGEGSLVNKAATISHDTSLGRYCDIAPGARILGRSTVGDYTEIGANAVVLPDVKVGSHCRIGAGAVVTKDIPDDLVVVGVPARPMTRTTT